MVPGRLYQTSTAISIPASAVLERDQAERVVEEMRADVSKKNEAGGHPQVPAQRTESRSENNRSLLATVRRCVVTQTFTSI